MGPKKVAYIYCHCGVYIGVLHILLGTGSSKVGPKKVAYICSSPFV